MAEPTSFGEWLAQNSSKYPTLTQPKKATFDPSKITTGSASSENGVWKTLGTVVDLISRPLYAVTESYQSLLEAPDELAAAGEKWSSGDTGGAIQDMLGTAGKTVSAPVRGFFSTHEDDKPLASDLIEQTTDTAGRRFNPDYQDVQDNVNPVLKGVAGFAVDVAADPLTWIPGGVIAGLLGKGGKAASALARGGDDAARTVDTAAEAAKPSREPLAIEAGAVSVDKQGYAVSPRDSRLPVTKPERPAPYSVLYNSGDDVRGVDNFNSYEEALEFTKMLKSKGWSSNPSLKSPNAFSLVRNGKKTKAQKNAEIAREIEEAKALKNAGNVAEGVKPSKAVAEALKKAEADLPPAQRVELEDAVDAMKGTAKVASESPEIVEQAAKRLSEIVDQNPVKGAVLRFIDELEVGVSKKGESVGGPYAGDSIKPPTLKEWKRDIFEAARTGALPASSSLLKTIQGIDSRAISREYKKYVDDFYELAAEGVRMSPSGRMTDLPARPAEGVEQSVTTALDRFTEMYDKSGEAVDKILGAKLAQQLSKMSNPERFDAQMSKLKEVLENTGMLDTIDFSDYPALRSSMARFGITNPEKYRETVLALPNSVEDAVSEGVEQAAAGVPKQGLDETLEMMRGSEEMTPELSAAIHGIERTLRKNTDIDNLIDEQGMTLSSKSGTLRNAEKKGVGEGRDFDFANTFFQYDLWKSTQIFVRNRLEKTGPKRYGLDKALAVQSETIAAMKIAEKFLIQNGYPLHVSRGTERVPLTFTEVYEEIAKQGDVIYSSGRGGYRQGELLMAMLFNYPATGGLPPTNLMQAVTSMLRGGDNVLEEVAERLASVAKENGKVDGKPIPSFFEGVLDSPPRSFSYWNAPVNRKSRSTPPNSELPFGGRWAPKIVEGKVTSWRATFDSDAMLTEFLDVLTQARVPLAGMAARNADAYKVQFKRETMNILKTDIDEVLGLVSEGKLGSAIAAVAKLGDKAAKATGKKKAARPDSVKTAAVLEEGALPEGVRLDAKAAAAASARTLQGDRAGGAKISQKRFDDRQKEVNDLDEEIFTKGLDPDDPDFARIQARLLQQKMKKEELQREKRGLPPRSPASARQSGPAPRPGQPKPKDNPLDEEFDITATRETRAAYAGINAGRMAFLEPLKAAFSAGHDMVGKLDLYRLQHKAGMLQRTRAVELVDGLNKLNRQFSDFVTPGSKVTYIKAAFQMLQKGNPPSDPKMAAAYTELKTYMDTLFDISSGGKDGALGNVFFRENPLGIDYINKLFTDWEVLGSKTPADGIFFNLTKDMKSLVESGVRGRDGQKLSYLDTVFNQWRDWDVEDPLEFLQRVNVAAMKMATDVNVAKSFVSMAKKAGYTSTTPKAGYARLTAEGDSTYAHFAHFFGGQNLYYDKEVLFGLSRMDEVSRQSKGLSSSLGQFVQKYVDPVQNSWKIAITIYRPGHHVRNFVGNLSMIFLANGAKGFRAASRDAWKVMAIRGDYKGIDVMKALESLDVRNFDGVGETIVRGKWNMTTGDILENAHKAGFLPPAHIIEDMYSMAEEGEVVASGLKTVMDKLTLRGTKLEQVAGGVSQGQDHYARLTHYIQFLNNNQGKYKKLDDLLDAAELSVLKWHPDASLLTNFESKYLRRIIPFYSWTRGAIPAIAEAVVMNPGRVNAFNKANYNLAVAMGVNPESLHDPFPADQLFPSFLSEQMEGPQFNIGGQYFRVNPGIATWDVMNTFGPDPLRGLLGMTTPLVRTPIELLAGGSLATGARINDSSDYLDATIPGVNYVSNISGYSVTGSLASMLQGDGLDRQFQVDRGNKTAADQQLSALNWLTGAGIQNYSKPNFINYAEIEKRNREGEQRGF